MNGEHAQQRYRADPNGNANYLSESVHHEFEQAFGSVSVQNPQTHNVLPQNQPVNQHLMGNQGFHMVYTGQPVQMPQNNQVHFGEMGGPYGSQPPFSGFQGSSPAQIPFPDGHLSVNAGHHQFVGQGILQNNHSTPQYNDSFNTFDTMHNLAAQDPLMDGIFPPQNGNAEIMDSTVQEPLKQWSRSNSSSSLGDKEFVCKRKPHELERIEVDSWNFQKQITDPLLHQMSPDPNSVSNSLLEAEDVFSPSPVQIAQGQVSPKRKLSLSESILPPRDRSAVQNAHWECRREALKQNTPDLSPGQKETFQNSPAEGLHQNTMSENFLPQSQNVPYHQDPPVAAQAGPQELQDYLASESLPLQYDSQGQNTNLQSTPYQSSPQSGPEYFAYLLPEGMHLCSKCGNFHTNPPPGYDVVSCGLPSPEEYPNQQQQPAASVHRYQVQKPLPPRKLGPTTLHRFNELKPNVREKIWLYAMKNEATESAFCISGSLYGAPKDKDEDDDKDKSKEEGEYRLPRAELHLRPNQHPILLVNKAVRKFAQQVLQPITLNEDLKFYILPKWDTLCLSINHFQITGWDKRQEGGSMQYLLPPNQAFPQVQHLHLEIKLSMELRGVFKVHDNIKTSETAAIHYMYPESAKRIKAAFPNVKTVKYFCCTLPWGFEARHAIGERWARDVSEFFWKALVAE